MKMFSEENERGVGEFVIPCVIALLQIPSSVTLLHSPLVADRFVGIFGSAKRKN